MKKRMAGVAVIAAALTMGISGSAMAAPILQVELAPAGTGYNSDGTFDGVTDVINAVCAEAGQQDLDVAEGLSASLCDTRPVGENEPEGSRGSELLTADTSAVPPQPGVPTPSGFGSDGLFDALKNACALGTLVGMPIEGQTVEVAPGVVVKVCAD